VRFGAGRNVPRTRYSFARRGGEGRKD
jgi:hypothetical protein